MEKMLSLSLVNSEKYSPVPIFRSIWGMCRQGWKFGCDYCRNLRRKCSLSRPLTRPYIWDTDDTVNTLPNHSILIWCNAVWMNKSPWKLELTSISSFWPKSGIYFSIGVKNLYAMVVGIGYNDSIRIAYGDVMRMLQMSGFTAHNTEFAHKRAIRLKNL